MRLLALDLSTSSTGIATFQDGKLTEYYCNSFSDLKKSQKTGYPHDSLARIRRMVGATLDIIEAQRPDVIYIEEINRGCNRIAQKTLDGLHYVLLNAMKPEDVVKVKFMDSDGATGWRSPAGLNLRLTPEQSKANKKLKGSKKITKKDLALAFVESHFGIGLAGPGSEDIADAICMGYVAAKLESRLK